MLSVRLLLIIVFLVFLPVTEASASCKTIKQVVEQLALAAERSNQKITVWLHVDNHPEKPCTLIEMKQGGLLIHIRYFSPKRCLTRISTGHSAIAIGPSPVLLRIISEAAIIYQWNPLTDTPTGKT